MKNLKIKDNDLNLITMCVIHYICELNYKESINECRDYESDTRDELRNLFSRLTAKE